MTSIDLAADAGLVPERVRALEARVRREVDEGLLPACQYALARGGRVVAEATFGDASAATRFPIFSATKALSVSAFWIVMAEYGVEPEDRVAQYLSGFEANGKDAVTIDHVLLHTAGFPYAPLGPPQWATHAGRLEAYRTWRLDWEPGTKYTYHATSAHWVLMDILETVTGTDFRSFIRSRVLEPLGLRALALGLPPAEQTNLAEVVYVGQAMTPDELEATFGIRELPAPPGSLESMGDFALILNDPSVREVGIPAGGAFSTAADLALFYQALLHDGRGQWDPEILRDATGRVRNRLPDPLTGVPANRTRGLIVAGDDGLAHMRGFGRTLSSRAFGHGGAGGQIALADPATGISFAYLTNGHDRHMIREARRGVALASLAGLVTSP